MKGALVLGLLCLIAVTTAKKASESIEDNVDGELPSVLETSEPHPAKKYGKDHKYYHHHSKHQKPLDSSEHKVHEKFESRKSKHVPKNAPHEVPPLEAELQADLRTSKKHLKDQHIKDAQQDLHLQDLTFEESLKQEKQPAKSPHQFQRGHHKMGHHFTQDKASNMEQSPLDIERKLFVEQNPKKENNKFSHPVLEDSFETLQGEKSNPDYEMKKHSKKSKKYKKPMDKAKKSKKMKNAKKDKKEKKNKKDKKSKKY